jgi:hypothetical protein
VGPASATPKTSGRCGRGKRSSHFGAQSSALELALVKTLKPSMIFAVKTSAAGAEAANKKMFCTFTGGSGETLAPKCASNLFGSDSSVSDGETVLVEWPCKRYKETTLALDIPKSSTSNGMFE